MVPYDAEKASLPSPGDQAVPVMAVLSSKSQAKLRLENILADEDVIRACQAEDLQPYCDTQLRNPQEMESFLARLFAAGCLKFSCIQRSRITPFFVRKKGGQQRLVLDC